MNGSGNPMVNFKKGVKRVDRGRHFHKKMAADGRYIHSSMDAHIDASGKVCVKEDRHAYRVECGCTVDTPWDLNGWCKAGLFVCKDHYERCPRNSMDPLFDPDSDFRLRPCLWRCWFLIHLARFVRWLGTPPKRKNLNHEG